MSAVKKNLAVAAFAFLAAASPAPAALRNDESLPRRGFWGVTPSVQGGAVELRSVSPKGTAAAIGLKPGDILLSVNGQTIANQADLQNSIKSMAPGSSVRVKIRRGQSVIDLRGRAAAAPREAYQNVITNYGTVPFHDGLLRTILTEPAGVSKPPVVFFIQGFSCSTIESPGPDDEFGSFAREFARAGIAFFRVEKPGIGDSRGALRCADISFETELDAFRTAYKSLVAAGYEPDRIFILGHSLGGIQGPLLAAEQPPRGVAVYGTILRNWADYTQDLDRTQDFMLTGEDPAAEYQRAEADRPAIREFFFEGRPLAKIVAEHPALKANMTNLFGWDGGSKAYGRDENFARALSKVDLPAAWRDTRSYVLSLYGESDIVALTSEDQRMIADVVNHYRPGTAEFIEVPKTMHRMDVVGNRDEFRRANQAEGKIKSGPFNPEVPKILINWIKGALARPPVSK